ncbi:MAG TPA: ABC transporter permease [Burkholderiales bacterium]|nr:ABC transporter permease [Burkholderiales bacterium]
MNKPADAHAVTIGFESVAGERTQLDVPVGGIVQRTYWQNVRTRVLRDPYTVACAMVLILIAGSAIFAPWIGLIDPTAANSSHRLLPVGAPGHLLGTDELGRDMLSRLVYGGRLSLMMGVLPVVLALVIGGVLGLLAGFVGGRTNMLIMRVTDVFYAFPSILLAVAIAGSLGAGLANALLAITIVFIPPVTRVTESVTTQVRSMDFVEAARASGASTYAIIRTHILGNVLGPVLVYATVLVSVSILIAAGLSFIGLGASPPAAEWGLMLNTLRESIFLAPLNAVLPGFMIFVTSMCFNLISDGLRSAMDVRF